jgi:hypothetical protein
MSYNENNPPLVVPVYLNQRLVFDLVAMLQGGIATVSRLETSSQNSQKIHESAVAKFSLADAFGSLLRIQLGAEKNKDRENDERKSISQERIHTPASLFFELRSELYKRKLITNPSNKLPAPGDFVEFTASMRRNPLIEGIDQITDLIAIADVFTGTADTSTSSKSKTKMPSTETELSKLAKQLKHIGDSLKVGTTQDLFATNMMANQNALVTVESQFLNDNSMSDLIDGTFTVLGKAMRVVESPGESISLLRKASVIRAPQIVTGLIDSFKNLQGINGMSIPDMKVELNGPAFQVLPIAIFS